MKTVESINAVEHLLKLNLFLIQLNSYKLILYEILFLIYSCFYSKLKSKHSKLS